jgi:hypothetical protein
MAKSTLQLALERGTTKRVLGQTRPGPDERVLTRDPLVGITDLGFRNHANLPGSDLN